VTLPKELARAGYDTGFIGKWHVDGHGRSAFIPKERRQGFDYWKALECTHDYNHSLFYGDGPQRLTWPGYDTFQQTADAIGYVKTHAQAGKPFFLTLSWGPPHEPYQTAPERFRQLYSPAGIKLRPNVPAEAERQARTDLAGYYAHCTALDESFGQLWQALKDSGIEDNTVLLFTSDHGDMLWSHGFQKKQQPYEESARIPMLLHYPKRYGRRGELSTAAIATEDLMPTLLRLTGTSVPKTVEGKDFSGCLSCDGDPAGGVASISCPAPFGQWSRARGGREYRAFRTERYTYARDLKGPWLLYDNKKDPYQERNLVGDPESAKLVSQMDAKLGALLKKRGDAFLPAADYISKWGYTVDATGTVPYEP
jgi:arylsulfatase A-like enzyme